MTRDEIRDVLRRCASIEIREDGHSDTIGSIARSYKHDISYSEHYENCKVELESLPWNVVKDPRNPKDGEYPIDDGTYITMIDCNEHEVFSNNFRKGFWTLYHGTHIKWWMKLPEK